MADYNARIAPFINIEFWVTSEWWEQPRNHRGLDIATASALGSQPLYSMCDGQVVLKSYDRTGYGYYIIMKDNTTNMGFLYAHLSQASPLNVGDSVSVGQFVGYEGSTGSSTGLHLHLEMQDLTNHNWIFRAPKEYYSNPADFMGIPNQEGISAIYDGTPEPTPPSSETSINNWLISKAKRVNLKIKGR